MAVSLLLCDRNNSQVCTHGANGCGGRHAQGQAAAVIADPESQSILVWLRIVGGERELDGGNLLSAELNGLALQGSDDECERAIIDQHGDGVSFRRREIEGA